MPYNDEWVTVELETTPSAQFIYVYPPQMDLTADELDHYEDKAQAVVQAILNYMSKNLGWSFGLPELTNWQHHIGFDSPAPMGQYAEKYCIKSDDGSVVTSNSDGRSEIEFQGKKAPVYAKVWLELPGKVMSLETTISALTDDLKALAECMTQAKNAMTDMAQIHGIIAKEQAQDLAGRMNGAPEDPAFASDNDKKEKYGGMYR